MLSVASLNMANYRASTAQRVFDQRCLHDISDESEVDISGIHAAISSFLSVDIAHASRAVSPYHLVLHMKHVVHALHREVLQVKDPLSGASIRCSCANNWWVAEEGPAEEARRRRRGEVVSITCRRDRHHRLGLPMTRAGWSSGNSGRSPDGADLSTGATGWSTDSTCRTIRGRLSCGAIVLDWVWRLFHLLRRHGTAGRPIGTIGRHTNIAG